MRYIYQIVYDLKSLQYIILLFFFSLTLSAQNLYLKINGKNTKETTVIDSIGYIKNHSNTKSILDNTTTLTTTLNKIGYLDNYIINYEKSNDSTFTYNFNLGQRTTTLHIYIGKNPEIRNLEIFNTTSDTLTIAFQETEPTLSSALSKLERKGYSLAKLKLVNIQRKSNHLTADLETNLQQQRKLNDIIITGYDKFPEGHKKNLKRLYKNKTFNQETLQNLYSDLEKFRFANQTKYPEILFTKDSTKIYVYLEKAKSNNFDGFIGFSNDDKNKLQFNGYLDLVLNNALNTGEKFTLYWKSDGNQQKTFNVGIELPYVFQTPFALKANLNIFTQDSTFQNTQTAVDLGYFINYNTRIYLGYLATESNDIQNQNNSSISDYKNAFYTGTFEFLKYKPDNFLFPEQYNINFKAGTGKRNSNFTNNNQFFVNLNAKNNFYLNPKNVVNIKTQVFYLQSENYILNELHRFGGINSIRGFNENSLQGNLYSSILTEYRYILAPNLYIHSIIDYGYYQDKLSKTSNKLLGLGFGFGLLTKNGLLNLVYANGSTNEQQIKLSNSIVHISFKANF